VPCAAPARALSAPLWLLAHGGRAGARRARGCAAGARARGGGTSPPLARWGVQVEGLREEVSALKMWAKAERGDEVTDPRAQRPRPPRKRAGHARAAGRE
jgi:hypothetical protein